MYVSITFSSSATLYVLYTDSMKTRPWHG